MTEMNIEKTKGTEKNWKEVFSFVVSEKIGYNIGVDHIHSDENGWYYYINQKSLLPKHPLLMMHYRGPLFAVIPYMEYKQLENGTLDVNQYIDEAKWHFGYYWGGGSLVGGSFWQPLEDCVGIHDTEKISRYLHILSCRTNKVSSGYMPRIEECMKCSIEKCPFSQCELKNADSNWKVEVQEHDYRHELFKALSERAKSELDVNLRGLLTYCGENILLIPNELERSCRVSIPVSLNNDILYHPGDRNWSEIVEKYKFELGIFWKEDRLIINLEQSTVSATEFCKNFWSAFGVYEKWDLADAQKEKRDNENAMREAEKALDAARKSFRESKQVYEVSKKKCDELEVKMNGKVEEKLEENDHQFFRRIGKIILAKVPFIKK